MGNSWFNNDYQIFVLLDTLNYKSKEEVQIMTIKRFARLRADQKEKTSQYLWARRITPAHARRIQRERLKEQYSRDIQKKYNVGPDWEQNRWFVEQVRPHL